MEWFHQIRRGWPIVALSLFYIYLAFHALSGNQGLVSWVDYENDIVRNMRDLEAIRAERKLLEARTDAMRSSHLDVEVLDLKARELVYLAHPQERVIWLEHARNPQGTP